MEDKPIKVSLIGKEGNQFFIKFPNLKIPVSVNQNLYDKMLNSTMYQFTNLPKNPTRANSA